MKSEPFIPSNRAHYRKTFRAGSGSWLIPISLLILCLATATAFFLATGQSQPRKAAVEENGPPPVRGGIFHLPLDGYIWTLDPARAARISEISIAEQIYDGLTALDENLNVVPALARYWEISQEGKVYTFELRPDARFHNGRPVTAEDCVYSFQRLLTPGLNTNNYDYYSRIEGAREFREGLAKHVSGLRALDERTFQIRFTSPFVPALSVLSMYSSKILPKHELLEKGDDFFMAPVGTGPFRFSRWIGREEDPLVPLSKGIPQALRLEANRNYFGNEAYLDAVTFRYVDRPLHERFDFIPYTVENVLGWTPVEVDRLLSVYYFVLPNEVEPYDDPRVRRALSYVMDKRSFLDSRLRTTGAPAADGIVPPGIPGFLPMDSTYKRNLERAKTLLADAGHPNGRGLPPLELLVYEGDMASVAGHQCLKSCLAEIGVKVKEVKVTRHASGTDMELSERTIMYETGWIADFPDPDNFLRPLFHSTSPANLSGYDNPEVDRLLDQAWTETSYSTRNKLYHKIETIVLRDSPVIPLHYGQSRYLVRPKVRGLRISPMGLPYMKLNRVWLSETETVPAVEF
jgi:peptide/nickel transport system substrate-binding protein/oligopeptide transport system substrate-binding protein